MGSGIRAQRAVTPRHRGPGAAVPELWVPGGTWARRKGHLGGGCGGSSGWGNTKCTCKPRAAASPFSQRGSRPPLLGTCPSLQGQITELIIQHGGPHSTASCAEQQQTGRQWNTRRSYVFSNGTEQQQPSNTADRLFKNSPGWAWSWDERCISSSQSKLFYAGDHTCIKLARTMQGRKGTDKPSQLSDSDKAFVATTIFPLFCNHHLQNNWNKVPGIYYRCLALLSICRKHCSYTGEER